MRIVSFIILFVFLTASAVSDARKANAAFERGDYAEAVQLYRQAIQQDPENARLHFNLGNALSQLGQKDEAAEAYSRFNELADSPVDQSMADYNMGRMLTDDENYEEALNYFREALIKNPNDDDARHNFELAVKRQQQNEQEQPEDDSGGDGGDDEDQQQDQNDDQDQEPQMDQQPDSPQDQDGDGEQEQRPLDMSPEEAENILDALEQLERELLENRKKESSSPPSRNERDW
ncbi:MAG: tetratricopeptide repeat protein [Balneolaceae bacterium]|nr:tetratricopeptide repeat protein [Balneolaceae bacterium]